MTEYRNESVQLTVGQMQSFLMGMLPHGDKADATNVVDAALEAGFFQLSGKQDAPAFVFPNLAGITVAEVDARMQTLVEEITEAVNESMRATAVKAYRAEDEAREPKEFVVRGDEKK